MEQQLEPGAVDWAAWPARLKAEGIELRGGAAMAGHDVYDLFKD